MCSSCSRQRHAPPRLPPRRVVINAFDDDSPEQAASEARRAHNGNDRPADFAAFVAMVERYAAQQPINELEVACHGTGIRSAYGTPNDDEFDGPGEKAAREAYQERVRIDESDNPAAQGLVAFYPRGSSVREPGGLMLGRRATTSAPGFFVSGRTLASDPHRGLMVRLGRAVIPGGRIIWQACDIANRSHSWGDFLGVAGPLAPHISMHGAHNRTVAGTDGLRQSDLDARYVGAPAGGIARERIVRGTSEVTTLGRFFDPPRR